MHILRRLRWRDDEVETAFGEFPHYEFGDLTRSRHGRELSGHLVTQADPPGVIGYYRDQLEAHGWEVESGVAEFGLDMLLGRRGDLLYQITFEEGDGVEWGTHAAITVKRQA